MAHYNSLEDAFKDLDRQFAEFQKDAYKIEGDLFYKYDRDIREVTPIDTGRTRRYPPFWGCLRCPQPQVQRAPCRAATP